MIRQDVMNNTSEQVEEYIRAALVLVEVLNPDDDLRPHVFVQAVNLYSGKQIVMQQPQPLPPNLAIPRGL